MQIRTTQRHLYPRAKPSNQSQEAKKVNTIDSLDTVSLMGEAGHGALRGGAGGMLVAGVLVTGGALNMLANGGSIDMTEFGLALGQATSLALAPSLLAGATTGALSHVAGVDSSKSSAISVAGGSIAGGAAIAYSVYQVLKALESFTG